MRDVQPDVAGSGPVTLADWSAELRLIERRAGQTGTPPGAGSCAERRSLRNVEQAKQCLRLIRDIADRGASSWDPRNVGYTLQELSQVLLERTGNEDRVFN